MPNDGIYADGLIRHRLYLLRYEAGVAKRMVAAYDAAFAGLTTELADLTRRIEAGESIDTERKKRLQAKLRALDAEIRALKPELESTLGAGLSEVADAEAAYHLSAAKRIGINFTDVPADHVAAAVSRPIGGELWNDRLANDLFAAREGVQSTIARAIAQGASIPKTAAMLRAAGDITETYRGRLVSIARTEIQRVANEVAIASYEQNADVLDGVEWLATLDSRTCLVCAPLHGTTYPMVNGKVKNLPRPPPLHPRCRCFTSPITKSWAEILGGPPAPGQKDAKSGGPTFDQWLRRQPADVQLDVLGEARRELWRGGAPLTGFSDVGRVLSLGELRDSVSTRN